MGRPSKPIAVVGQGVIGLTCAARLLGRGYAVEVYSRDDLGDSASMAAGAYWWPHRIHPEARVLEWARVTHGEYAVSGLDPGSGVHFEEHFRFCMDPDDSLYVRDLLGEWESIEGVDYGVECREAYRLVVPVIDVPVFMPCLRRLVERDGARFHLRDLASPAELFPGHALVVNCTGLGAREFAQDPEVFPVRGQTVRVARPEGLRASTRLYAEHDQFTLVLPRSNDVVLGGCAQAGDWDRSVREEETRAILERCSRWVPAIAGAGILGVCVGLRPGRREVRLELETMGGGRPVIHNYGHGGGGFTVAWGCADEVVALADSYFAQL